MIVSRGVSMSVVSQSLVSNDVTVVDVLCSTQYEFLNLKASEYRLLQNIVLSVYQQHCHQTAITLNFLSLSNEGFVAFNGCLPVDAPIEFSMFGQPVVVSNTAVGLYASVFGLQRLINQDRKWSSYLEKLKEYAVTLEEKAFLLERCRYFFQLK